MDALLDMTAPELLELYEKIEELKSNSENIV